MDKRRKCALALMELGDSIIEKKRRRASIIRRAAFSVSGLCAAVLIGVGIWSNSAVQTPPDREPSSSIMVTETSPATESPQTTAVPSTTVTAQAVRSTTPVTTAQAVTGTVPSTERQAPARTESTPSVSSATVDIPSVTTTTPVTQPYVTDPGTTAAVTATVTQTQTATTPETAELPTVTTTVSNNENLYDPRKTYTFELDGITYEVSSEAANPEFFQSIDFVEYTEMLTEDDSGNVTSVKGCIASAQPLSEMVSFQILCVVETENGQEYFIAHAISDPY